jgi:hypothetical protein
LITIKDTLAINWYWKSLVMWLTVYLIDFDALGKPGAGILMGNTAWLGSYGECTNIYGAAYCLAGIAPITKRGNQVSLFSNWYNYIFNC